MISSRRLRTCRRTSRSMTTRAAKAQAVNVTNARANSIAWSCAARRRAAGDQHRLHQRQQDSERGAHADDQRHPGQGASELHHRLAPVEAHGEQQQQVEQRIAEPARIHRQHRQRQQPGPGEQQDKRPDGQRPARHPARTAPFPWSSLKVAFIILILPAGRALGTGTGRVVSESSMLSHRNYCGHAGVAVACPLDAPARAPQLCGSRSSHVADPAPHPARAVHAAEAGGQADDADLCASSPSTNPPATSQRRSGNSSAAWTPRSGTRCCWASPGRARPSPWRR